MGCSRKGAGSGDGGAVRGRGGGGERSEPRTVIADR